MLAVYTWKGEILKARDSVHEKSSKLRIGPWGNQSLRCGRTQTLQGTSLLINKVSFFKRNNSGEGGSEYVIPAGAFQLIYKINLQK